MPGLLENNPEQEIPGIETEERDMVAQPLNDRIEPHIREQLGKEHEPAFDQVIDQGMELLFGKETSEKLFSSIRPDDQVPIADELGTAATNIMAVMYEKSGGSIPGEVIIPAGTILLARSIDYINEAGIDQVSDEDFGSAMELFVDMIQDKLDPEYAQNMGAGQLEDGAPQEADPLLQGGA